MLRKIVRLQESVNEYLGDVWRNSGVLIRAYCAIWTRREGVFNPLNPALLSQASSPRFKALIENRKLFGLDEQPQPILWLTRENSMREFHKHVVLAGLREGFWSAWPGKANKACCAIPCKEINLMRVARQQTLLGHPQVKYLVLALARASS
ncbi:hypothetical protein N5P37_003490 [Trichoderma harzianum]|nr:hypothetical protein N5P37_003490 [Trichoderma harzianum]